MAPGLLTNIRLGWKGIAVTNTLAYYKAIFFANVIFLFNEII
jgi:hypothetical protein